MRHSIRRLFGLALAVIPFGLGLLGILFDERRRGWQDKFARVDVLYESNERTPAPWSKLSPAEEDPDATKAPESRGLRPTGVAGPPLGG